MTGAELDAALRRIAARMPGSSAPEEYMRRLADGRLQAFPAGAGSVIVASLTRDGRAHISAAAGRLDELLAALPCVERWYRRQGASRMTASVAPRIGRKGWARVLASHGYVRAGHGHLLVKGLCDG